MVSAGSFHSVLLRNDGKVAIAGTDVNQENASYNLTLKKGPFKQVSAGGAHTLLLTQKGSIVSLGSNRDGQCNLPERADASDSKIEYVQVSAGENHSVALRSDGQLVIAGKRLLNGGTEMDAAITDSSSASSQRTLRELNYTEDDLIYDGDFYGLPAIRFTYMWKNVSDALAYKTSDPLNDQLKNEVSTQKVRKSCGGEIELQATGTSLKYVQVSAGYAHHALLRSDGKAYARGANESGQCDVPDGRDYVQVSAGGAHTVLLRRDGEVLAVGSDEHGQCSEIKSDNTLSSGMPHPRCVNVSAGCAHTVLLCSDGTVKAVGCNSHGQCDIPELQPGVKYIQASAGGQHTILLRSDGQALIAGEKGDISIPDVAEHQTWFSWGLTKPVLPDGVHYVADSGERPVEFKEAASQ
jgi:alpha-tubulin suppressor-like RCC1 family protein